MRNLHKLSLILLLLSPSTQAAQAPKAAPETFQQLQSRGCTIREITEDYPQGIWDCPAQAPKDTTAPKGEAEDEMRPLPPVVPELEGETPGEACVLTHKNLGELFRAAFRPSTVGRSPSEGRSPTPQLIAASAQAQAMACGIKTVE